MPPLLVVNSTFAVTLAPAAFAAVVSEKVGCIIFFEAETCDVCEFEKIENKSRDVVKMFFFIIIFLNW